MVAEFINKTRIVILRHKEVFETNQTYLDITKRFDELVDLYYTKDQKKAVSDAKLEEMARELLMEYYAFESNHRKNRFLLRQKMKKEEIKKKASYIENVGNAKAKSNQITLFVAIFVILGLISIFSVSSPWFFGILFIVGIYIFYNETL